MGLGGRLLNSFPIVLFSFEVVWSFSWGVINGAKCFHPNFWARLLAIVSSLNICKNLAEKPHRAIKVLNVDFWPLNWFLWRLSISTGFLIPLESIWMFLFFRKLSPVARDSKQTGSSGTCWKIVSLAHPHCSTQKVEKDQRQSMLGICIIQKEKKLLINAVLEVKCPCSKYQCNHLHSINGLYKCQICQGRWEIKYSQCKARQEGQTMLRKTW